MRIFSCGWKTQMTLLIVFLCIPLALYFILAMKAGSKNSQGLTGMVRHMLQTANLYGLSPETRGPSTCSSYSQYLAIYVHSATEHSFKRELIRQTWGSPEVLKKLNATLVFILGQSKNPHVTEAVAKEVQRYKDIVQGDFLDTYKNICIKALTALEWVTTHCQHSRYLLKTDDDIFVDIFALVRHLMTEWDRGVEKTEGLLLCNYWTDRNMPFRNEDSKWYVSYAEYNQLLYPPFCQGAAYVMTPDVASALYQKSFSVKRLWLDDVYITGLLREAAGVSATEMNIAYKGSELSLDDLSEWTRRGSPLFVLEPKVKLHRDLWRYVMNLERVRQVQVG